ncbi:hypothetical protein ACFL1I_00125 [Candidatus Omnitrophota bacterium]
MNKGSILLTAISLLLLGLLVTEPAFARSQTLTSTIVITVKPVAQTNLLPNDENAEVVTELAEDQSMSQPYIKASYLDSKVSGEKIYSIVDRL